jgi:hypothetical protein
MVELEYRVDERVGYTTVGASLVPSVRFGRERSPSPLDSNCVVSGVVIASTRSRTQPLAVFVAYQTSPLRRYSRCGVPEAPTSRSTHWLMTPPVLKPSASTTSSVHAVPFQRPYMSAGCVPVVKARATFEVVPSYLTSQEPPETSSVPPSSTGIGVASNAARAEAGR